MIDYISKFQNNFVSSYLFKYNLPIMMEKGISIEKLVCEDSSIFKIYFDFDDWPANHTDNETMIRPYNESYFHVRYHYKKVFPEDRFDFIDGKYVTGLQVYKIKYSINLMPSIGEYFQMDSEG